MKEKKVFIQGLLDCVHFSVQKVFLILNFLVILFFSQSNVYAGIIGAYSIAVGDGPCHIAYNPSNGYMYVTNFYSDSVSVINDTNVIDTIAVGDEPCHIAYNPSNGYMYVTNFYSDSVSVINDTNVIDTIAVGDGPCHIAYNPSNGYMYVVNCYSDNVSVINDTSVIDTIAVGEGPCHIAYNPSNGYMYVANQGSANVSVINDTSVVATIAVGGPQHIAYNPSNGYMYVANYPDSVSVINDTSVIATIAAGHWPRHIAYNPSNGYMYVANKGSANVSVINDTNVIDTIAVGDFLGSIAYNPSNGYMYVANYYSDNVSKIGEKPAHIVSDTAYTSDHSPYEVFSPISIDADAILTIEDGVELRFPLEFGITVNGTLNINGTEQSHVLLTSAENVPEPGDWLGIVFQEDSGGYINHAHVEYGGGGPEQANIIFRSGYPIIENSYISNSYNHGIYITGGAQPIVQHNSITNNTRGMYIDFTSSPSINNNFVSNNVYGIYCDTSGNPLVYLNDIFGNTIYGLFNAEATTNVAATQNWWGDCSGPYNFSINPSGLGDPVSDYVSFAPWLCKSTPEVLSITPDNGFPASTVTIEGSNFMEGQGEGSVTFNGIESPKICYWSDSRIVAEVPSDATTGPVVVTTSLGSSNDDVIFTVSDNTLILSFPFEDDGGTTTDASGNGNDGIVNGAVFTPGCGILNSNAYQFNWSALDNIQVSYQGSQTATEVLTLEAWVYPTAWDNIYTHYNRIVSKQPVYFLRGMANGHAHFQILTENHGYQGVSDSQVMSLNEWHYVVGIFDGLFLRLYVDGILRDSLELPEVDSISTNEADIFVGESQGLAEGFTGTIDNVAIYKRARSQSEIEETYASVVPSCEGDFDGDSDVDGSDLSVFAADFGRTDCDQGEECEGDFNGDGDVDGSDLAVFAADFGRTNCP